MRAWRSGGSSFQDRRRHAHSTGRALSTPDLLTLLPGRATCGGIDSIWFRARIDDERHGLIGVVHPN
jgi:hypothetical protein